MPGQLAAKVRAKFPGAYDDMDDAALERAVLAKHPEYADLANPEPQKTSLADAALMDNPLFGPVGRAAQGLLRMVKAHPVESAAMAGAGLAVPLTGGASIPAAMTAVGLGGAGGAGTAIAARQLATGRPESATDTLKTMGKQGALSAVGEGAGQLGARALLKGGKLLYRSVLAPSKNLQKEFGNVVETGLREKALVPSSLPRIENARNVSGATARNMVTEAEQAGASPVTTREVAMEFAPVFQQGRRQVDIGRPDPRPAVVDRLQQFANRHPAGIPLSRAQVLKEEAQDLASRAYRAADRGGPVTDISTAADEAMARGLRGGIEARVPGVAAQNTRTQDLIGLSRALEDASMRNPSGNPLHLLLRTLMPNVASGGAIGAAGIGSRPALTTNPVRALLEALMGGEQ